MNGGTMPSRQPVDTDASSDDTEAKPDRERELLEELANTSVDEIARRQRLLGELRKVRRGAGAP